MIRRKILSMLALAGAAALSACAPLATHYVPQGLVQAPSHRCDTRFQVVNHSSRPILTLQYSHSSELNWGPDQLGSSVIRPGQIWNARAAHGGRYDFRVTWVGGRAEELREVNVCRVSRIVVTNSGVRSQ